MLLKQFNSLIESFADVQARQAPMLPCDRARRRRIFPSLLVVYLLSSYAIYLHGTLTRLREQP
jgi:hypothetical protein